MGGTSKPYPGDTACTRTQSGPSTTLLQADQSEIRQLKAEMRERGIKVTSFMNRQPSLEAARANERLFALKMELEKATCGSG